MDEKTQKRWKTIVNVLYFAIFFAAFYLAVRYLFITLFPFVLAFVIAFVLQRPVNFLQKKKIPRGISSVVLSLLCYLVVVTIIGLLGTYLVGQVKDFATDITQGVGNLAEFVTVLKTKILSLGLVTRLPESIRASITGGLDQLLGYVQSGDLATKVMELLTKYSGQIAGVVSSVPSVLIAVIVSVAGTCFMTSGFEDIKTFIVRQFKTDESRAKLVKTKHVLTKSVGKLVKSYALIMLLTGSELFVGLLVLKFCKIYTGSHIVLISIATAIVDIIPVLGTGTVLIPWALYTLISGKIGMGIGLIVIYVIITVVRQFVEPKLVAGQVGMSPVVTIIAMYVGVKYFGVMGFLLVPFAVIIIKLLNDEGIIHIMRTKESEENERLERERLLAAENENSGDENNNGDNENSEKENSEVVGAEVKD